MIASPALLSTFACGLLLAQTPSAPGAQPAPEKPKNDCVVSGQVLNLVTGEPLRKAKATLSKQDARNAGFEREVNVEGKFEFRDLEPGRYTLRAARNGFVSQAYGAKKPGEQGGTTITLAPSEEMKGLVVKLTPHSVVMGRVLDEDGEPMADMQVAAVKQEWQGRKRQWTPHGTATTNDLGEYRIYGVAPGSYLFRASRQMMGSVPTAVEPLSEKPEETYVSTWYPGTTDSSMSPKVVVRPGAEMRGIDFRMAKTRVVRIRGKVLSPTTGRPTTGFVMLLPRGKGYTAWSEMRNAFTADPKQGFELKDVPAGKYVLRVQSGEQENQSVYTQHLEVGDSHIDGLLIRPGPGGEIQGKVEMEDGKIDEQTSVLLESADEDEIGMSTSYARLKEDGTFTLKNVQPGHFRVRCYGPDLYVKAVSAGNQDLLENSLDTTEGLPSSIQIKLSGKSPEVGGTVQNKDNKPVPGATVVLVPEEKRRTDWGAYGQGTTDQYGEYKVKNLRPGKYKAYAWEDLDGPEYMDPEFLKPLESKGVDVALKEGAKETLALTLIPTEAADQEKPKK
jgi:protocatechuate 3,4-dioxygenase beta subunit